MRVPDLVDALPRAAAAERQEPGGGARERGFEGSLDATLQAGDTRGSGDEAEDSREVAVEESIETATEGSIRDPAEGLPLPVAALGKAEATQGDAPLASGASAADRSPGRAPTQSLPTAPVRALQIPPLETPTKGISEVARGSVEGARPDIPEAPTAAPAPRNLPPEGDAARRRAAVLARTAEPGVSAARAPQSVASAPSAAAASPRTPDPEARSGGAFETRSDPNRGAPTAAAGQTGFEHASRSAATERSGFERTSRQAALEERGAPPVQAPRAAEGPPPAPVNPALDSAMAPTPAPISGPERGATSALGTPAEALPLHVEWLAARGGGSARVRLHPPQLGEVELVVTLRGSAVDVVIRAHEPAAQALVGAHRELLADALATRELRMEQFEVLPPERDSTGGGTSGNRPFGDPRGGAFGDDGEPMSNRLPQGTDVGSSPVFAGSPSVSHTSTGNQHFGAGAVDLRI